MTRPLSLDIRVRVAAALTEGDSTREAAKRFGISVATAVRIGQLSRRGRGLSPRWIGGTRKPVLLGEPAELLRSMLAAKSDWTVRALSSELKARGVEVSHDSVWRFLRREGLSFKKNADSERAVAPEGGEVPGTLENASTQA